MADTDVKVRADALVNSVADDDVRAVDIPHRIFTQIAENLKERAERDGPFLQKRKYDLLKLELIPELCAQLRLKTSDFFDIRFSQPQSRKDFLEMRERADDIIYESLSAFDAAFYGHDDLMQKTSDIRVGDSHADTIQKLVDIKTVAERNRELLEAVGFDFTILDGIEELASKMASLLAKATADESESPLKRIARDKVFTALKNLLEELVRIARYAFNKDPKHQVHYTISYSPIKHKAKKKEEEKPEEKEVEIVK